MNLLKLIPTRYLRYRYTGPKGIPYNPAQGLGVGFSRNAWFQIGVPPSHLVLTGTQVAAVPLQGSGTRGELNIWAYWFAGLGGTAPNITVALLDYAGPDAIPPLYTFNATNCLAGRCYVYTQTGESPAGIASGMQGSIQAMLIAAGVYTKFTQAGGSIVANMGRADLGPGTVAITSPSPWMPSQLMSLSGAWTTAMDPALSFTEHPGSYTPEFLAGVRPAPWLVRGTPTPGLGTNQSIIE